MMDMVNTAINNGNFNKFLDNNGNFDFDLVEKAVQSTQLIEPPLPNDLELNHPSQGVHIIEDEEDVKLELKQQIKQYRKQQLYHNNFPQSKDNDNEDDNKNNRNNNSNNNKNKRKIKQQWTLEQFGFKFKHGCPRNTDVNKQSIHYKKGDVLNIVLEQIMQQKLKFIQCGDNINVMAKLVGVGRDYNNVKKKKNYFLYIAGIINQTKTVGVEINVNDFKKAKRISNYCAFKTINIGGWITMINGRIGIKANKVNLDITFVFLSDWYRMVLPQYKFFGQNIISIPKKYQQRWSKCSDEYRKQFIIKYDNLITKMEILCKERACAPTDESSSMDIENDDE